MWDSYYGNYKTTWAIFQCWINTWCYLFFTKNVGRQCYFSLCHMCPWYREHYSVLVECMDLVIFVFLLTCSQISHCNTQVYRDVEKTLFYCFYFNVVWWLKMRNELSKVPYLWPPGKRGVKVMLAFFTARSMLRSWEKALSSIVCNYSPTSFSSRISLSR